MAKTTANIIIKKKEVLKRNKMIGSSSRLLKQREFLKWKAFREKRKQRKENEKCFSGVNL